VCRHFAEQPPVAPLLYLCLGKAMIESYLFGLWEQGALAGPTPEAAYFVNIGLGKTMTTQDVLEGRMIVEIGIAAVRPAEFIILRFTHKLQEA
jgi:phage tail sheath protein FI